MLQATLFINGAEQVLFAWQVTSWETWCSSKKWVEMISFRQFNTIWGNFMVFSKLHTCLYSLSLSPFVCVQFIVLLTVWVGVFKNVCCFCLPKPCTINMVHFTFSIIHHQVWELSVSLKTQNFQGSETDFLQKEKNSGRERGGGGIKYKKRTYWFWLCTEYLWWKKIPDDIPLYFSEFLLWSNFHASVH